jgi:hypothetical protein
VPEFGLHAFIDESGHRASRSKGASSHFVMGAVIVPDESAVWPAAVIAWLDERVLRVPVPLKILVSLLVTRPAR